MRPSSASEAAAADGNRSRLDASRACASPPRILAMPSGEVSSTTAVVISNPGLG